MRSRARPDVITFARRGMILLAAAAAAATAQAQSPRADTATFAGGCFWCMVHPFDQLRGVLSVRSGYTGGHTTNPSLGSVASGTTGHAEAVEVIYDPARIGYDRLLDVFWHNIDPVSPNGQFCEQGSAYRSAIFVHGDAQRAAAEQSKQALARSGRLADSIATEIVPASAFYPAEAFNQNYYKKNAVRYAAYRRQCGRDRRLGEIWSTAVVATTTPKPSDDELRQRLTPIQYEVTQRSATERPFQNAYWDNHRSGIYVDVVSGEPLFSSTDKFESGTGWPSFTKPLAPANIRTVVDRSLFTVRMEVRSAHADSHLGHVFDDGPAPTGLRYCINSAALRFVSADSLAAAGYASYRSLFRIVTQTSAGKLQR